LASETVLVAGLGVLPDSLQNVQANPCAAEGNNARVEFALCSQWFCRDRRGRRMPNPHIFFLNH
jgi:hypothetical protein